jgi:oligopeptide/dipeptide ABC transporter ATP-binding protein
MYLGSIIETGSRTELFRAPKHPYTQILMAANPTVGRGKRRHRVVVQGDVPSPVNPPSGCRFHPRCPFATPKCSAERPVLKNVGTAAEPYEVACHYVTSMTDYPRAAAADSAEARSAKEEP